MTHITFKGPAQIRLTFLRLSVTQQRLSEYV